MGLSAAPLDYIHRRRLHLRELLPSAGQQGVCPLVLPVFYECSLGSQVTFAKFKICFLLSFFLFDEESGVVIIFNIKCY